MTPSAESRPKRIVLCLVANEHVIHRAAGAVRYLQIGLIDEPFDTFLVTPESGGSRLLAAGPANIVTHRSGSRFLSHWTMRRTAAIVQERIAELRHDGPVIVHALDGQACRLAAQIASTVGGQLVLTLSSLDDLADPRLPVVARDSALIIVPCRALCEAVEQSSFGHVKIETILVGTTATRSPSAFREPNRTPSLIYAGPLKEESGCDTLLRAVKQVLQAHPTLQVFLVGKGRGESALRALARALEVGSNVTFTGRLDNWRTALDGADVFCLPCRHRSVREEPLQAMADGLAMVAAENPLYESFADRATAMIYDEGEPTDLAERILELLEDRKKARQLAAMAQSYMREHHSIDRMITEHVRCYRQVAGPSDVIQHPAAR
ncbi:MAG: glycosyltransferase family 4 protein [Planctomycetota bacterium]|nr:glycosyltransferase family 4 protein [Planctomycetota bacterium]